MFASVCWQDFLACGLQRLPSVGRLTTQVLNRLRSVLRAPQSIGACVFQLHFSCFVGLGCF